MRHPLVVGNWKMHGTRASARALVDGIRKGLGRLGEAEVVVCPPYVYLMAVAEAIAGTAIRLGAQNVSAEDPGAFTGEVAAPMLVDVGCRYVVVGHSERRTLYGETDAQVVAKYLRAQREGLVPIVCVGEQLAERDSGRTLAVVERQVEAIVSAGGAAALAAAVLAYEPIWAIGTGRTATPDQAQDVHAFIRGRIADHDSGVAQGVRILYGGSVKASNARALFAMPDIDGGLIGGASLEAGEFLAVCSAAG